MKTLYLLRHAKSDWGTGGPDHERELSGSLRDRLTDTLERFEKSHPKITETIGRLADALSDMGI